MQVFKQWLLVVLLVVQCCGGVFAVEPVTNTTNVLMQEKLNTLDKEFSVFKAVQTEKLDEQNKRIDELNGQQAHHLSFLSLQATNFSTLISWVGVGFGALITLLLVVFAVFSYTNAEKRAADEGRKVAEKWFKENSEKLMEDFDESLKNELEEAENKIFGLLDSAQQNHDAISSLTKNNVENKTPQKELKEAENVLNQKPKNIYTAQDYYVDGLVQFNKENFTGALMAFERVNEILKDGLNPFLDVKTLVNKGAVFGLLGKHKQAIDVFDEVQKAYGKDAKPKTREQLPRALFKSEIREQVARALLNKGVALGKLGKNDEAIDVFGEVKEEYGKEAEPEIRELVEKAAELINELNSKNNDA